MLDIDEHFKSECINFSKEWLSVDDYPLKILVLTSALAENNLAFRGNLKTMCEWLGIKTTTSNHKNIKQAIDTLIETGYIFCKREGQTYHISITDKGMEENQIVRIRRCWITTFRNYKEQVKDVSISWLNLLKVFVYLYGNQKQDIFKQSEIAEALNISVSTVGTALKVIEQCRLKGLYFRRFTEKANVLDFAGNVVAKYNVGTNVSIMINFNDN